MARPKSSPAPCLVDGCGKLAVKKSLCETHYQRQRTTGTTDTLPRKRNKNSIPPTDILPSNAPRSMWIAWAAGFIDGEGSLVLSRGSKQGRGGWVYPRISAVNVDKSPLEVLQGLFGGRIRPKTRAKGTPDYHKNSFYWQVTGVNAVNIIQELVPFLTVKKEQAEILIEFQNGREYGGRGNPISQAEIARREALQERLAQLNRRGERVESRRKYES